MEESENPYIKFVVFVDFVDFEDFEDFEDIVYFEDFVYFEDIVDFEVRMVEYMNAPEHQLEYWMDLDWHY